MAIQHFKTAKWLSSGHLQTIWGSFFRPKTTVNVEAIDIPLRDNTQLKCELSWPASDTQRVLLDEGGIICVLMHGLTGSADSHYIKGIQKAIADSSLDIVTLAINHRGALGHLCPARHKSRLYHAGLVDDIQDTIEEVRRQWPKARIFMFGASLSGNMLVRALGVNALSQVERVMAVSVPFDLAMVADAVDQGLGKIYRRYLANRMKGIIALKQKYIENMPNAHFAQELKSFWALDNFVVAPLHGFRNVHHYYRECSSRPVMKNITQPLLVVQAMDDPLVPPAAWPGLDDLPDCVEFEGYDRGGHVGFIDNKGYWLERRVIQWLMDAI